MGRYKKKGFGKGTKNNPQTNISNYQTSSKNRATKWFTMNIEKQNRHIRGTPQFIEGRSEIEVSIEYLQTYFDNNRDKVQMIGKYQGWLTFDRIIGVFVDQETHERIKTNKVKIHFSKTGYHMVPTFPDKKGDK